MKVLSALMEEKFEIIKQYKMIEYKKYPWYDNSRKKIGTIGRWSYPDVKTKATPDGTVKLEWEIDGQTVKALERRGLLKAIEYASGLRGEYPTKYIVVEKSAPIFSKA